MNYDINQTFENKEKEVDQSIKTKSTVFLGVPNEVQAPKHNHNKKRK